MSSEVCEFRGLWVSVSLGVCELRGLWASVSSGVCELRAVLGLWAGEEIPVKPPVEG